LPVDGVTVGAGDHIQLYANTHDQYHNFVANVTAAWSLSDLTPSTGGVVAGDLVPDAGPPAASATFTGAHVGTCKINVITTVGSFSDITGTVAVVPAAASKFAITMTGGTTLLSDEDKPVSTPFYVRVTAQDAYGNTASYAGTVHLTSNAFGGTVDAVIASGGLVDNIAITPTVTGTGDRTITATDHTINTTDAAGAFTVN
jgi:hypothetical protein